MSHQKYEDAITVVNGSQDYGPGFSRWLMFNWDCYLAFEALTLKWLAKGRTHCGAKMIWEVLRYQTGVSESEVTFKLNNNRTADLARLFEAMHPEHAGVFEKRERRIAA